MRRAARCCRIAIASSLLALHASAFATNGDQRVGLNATQAGMAGAVVAMPEDSATLFTNPAGLAGLGMESVRLDMGFSLLNSVRDRVSFSRPAGYSGAVPAQVVFGWKDQTVYAIGLRKRMGTATTLRLGLNHGASPIGAAVVDTNLGSVAIVETHLGVGVTRKLTENLSGNFAYSHGFENSLTSPAGNRISLEQHWLHFQVTYQL